MHPSRNEQIDHLLTALRSRDKYAREQAIEKLRKKQKTSIDISLLIELSREAAYDDVRLLR